MRHIRQMCQIAQIIVPARVYKMLITVAVSALSLRSDSVTFRGKYLQISAKIWSEYSLLWAKAITEKLKNKARLCI